MQKCFYKNVSVGSLQNEAYSCSYFNLNSIRSKGMLLDLSGEYDSVGKDLSSTLPTTSKSELAPSKSNARYFKVELSL